MGNPKIRTGRSRGPQTAAGRQRAAQNARKHGLTGAQTGNPLLGEMLALLQAQFAGHHPDPQALLRLAEAETLLAQVLAMQRAILADLEGLLEGGSDQPAAVPCPTLAEVTARLRLLGRYRATAEVARHKALQAVLRSLRKGSIS